MFGGEWKTMTSTCYYKYLSPEKPEETSACHLKHLRKAPILEMSKRNRNIIILNRNNIQLFYVIK